MSFPMCLFLSTCQRGQTKDKEKNKNLSTVVRRDRNCSHVFLMVKNLTLNKLELIFDILSTYTVVKENNQETVMLLLN